MTLWLRLSSYWRVWIFATFTSALSTRLRAASARQAGKRLKQSAICLVNVLRPKNEEHFVDLVVLLEKFASCFKGDPRCLLNRITIGAATDRREGNRLNSIFDRELQRVPKTICQNLRFVALPACPDGADCVNHKTSRQSVAPRQFRFAGLATAERPTFCAQFRPGSAMNCAINSPAAEKRGVRRVHDGVDIELRDVAADDVDLSGRAQNSAT